MDAVISDFPADLLAERERLGLDNHDEVWDGVLHMVPPGTNEHFRLETELTVCLFATVKAAGLELRHEMGLFDPEAPGNRNFRVPDLTVYPPSVGTVRGADGAASLVVEIRSPEDESFEKLPYYEQLGVGEVLIIDRDTKVVRHWSNGDHGLTESPGDGAGRHRLACLPVELWAERGTLVVLVDGTRTEI